MKLRLLGRIRRNKQQYFDLIDIVEYSRRSGVQFASRSDALAHYLREGASRGMAPNPYFDAKWYADTYRIDGGPIKPFLDYVANGVRLGRSPSPRFDLPGYLARNPDIAKAGIDPLAHFLNHGHAEGRAPSPEAHRIHQSGLLKLDFYNLQLKTPLQFPMEAVEHYLEEGASRGMAPNPYFDAKWYADTYRIDGGTVESFLDYVANGMQLGRSPSPRFDLPGYLARNPDIAEAGVDPLAHFLSHGRAEGRAPSLEAHRIHQSGLLKLDFYNLQLKTPLRFPVEAVEHYLEEGAAAGLNPNAYFDTRWYLSTYTDVARQGRNPLLDFISRAPRYDRNPSSTFDCRWYLSTNPHVARGGNDPLLHFISWGSREGRSASPFVGDPNVPTRFAGLLAELMPQDGEIHFQSSFQIQPVPKSIRIVGAIEAASPELTVREDEKISIFPPQPYTALFRDVGIIGGTRLIMPNTTTLLSDEISTFWKSPRWAVRPHYFNMGSDGCLILQLTRRYPSRIDRGAHLMHEYGHNYFHAVAEVLPRLLAAEEIGLDPDIPLLIQTPLHPNIRQLIDIINVHGRELIPLQNGMIYTIGELHFLSDVSSVQDVHGRRHVEDTVLHRGLIHQVAQRIISALAPNPVKPWRHLYLSRGSRYRGLLNEKAVEEMLVGLGFELVSLDGLSLAAQVQLFRQATIVIAPTGAAITNILWCQPGAKVCVLAAQHNAMPTELWEQHGSVSGCVVTYLFGQRAFKVDEMFLIHDDYSIDLNELRNKVDDMLQS